MSALRTNRILIHALLAACVLFIVFAPLVLSTESVFDTQVAYAVHEEGHEETATEAGGGDGASSNVLDNAGLWIGQAILGIGTLFVGFAGTALDLSINSLVLGMGDHIRDGGIGLVVNNVWGVVRDFGNLIFIFGFIYIGIRTILQPDNTFTKRFLAQLIIAALLINFSLFFTKLVIDVSNVFAIEIDNLIDVDGDGIGIGIAKSAGVAGLFDALPPQNLTDLNRGGSFAFFMMGTIFLMITAFVLLAGAVMIVIRFVALILLMVFSPLLFALYVFPQTQKHAFDLGSKLFQYAFFAPVFLFLIYVSVQILDILPFGQRSSLAEAIAVASPTGVSPQLGFFDVVLQFLIAIAFVILSLQIAQRLSLVGGNQVVGVGNWMRKGIQGFVGRQTLGRASDFALKKFDRSQAKDGHVARGIRTLGLDRGIRSTLKTGKEAKFGSSSSYKSIEDTDKTNRAQYSKIRGVINLEKALKSGNTGEIEKAVQQMSKGQLEEAGEKILTDPRVMRWVSSGQFDDLMKNDEFTETQKQRMRSARQTAIQSVYQADRKALSKASTAHLEALGLSYLTSPSNAARLTSSQMDDLKKKLTENEFKTLAAARDNALKNIANGSALHTGLDSDLTADHILGQKPGEVSKMSADTLKALANRLSVATLAKIAQDGTLKKADQAEIRRIINSQPLPPTENVHNAQEWFNDVPLGKQFGK